MKPVGAISSHVANWELQSLWVKHLCARRDGFSLYRDPRAGCDGSYIKKDLAACKEKQAPKVRATASLVLQDELQTINTALSHELRKALARGSEAFTVPTGEHWPTADLTNHNRTFRAIAQVKPDVEDASFLSPEEIAKWQPIIHARVKRLDDATADCLDIISAIWLQRAKNPTDTIEIGADDFLLLRGRQKHKGGTGRRGGYNMDLRKEIASQLQALKNTFLIVHGMEVTETVQGMRGSYHKRRNIAIESPVIVVTGRAGQLTLTGELEPFRWNIRPGDVFAKFLFGAGAQVALMARKALEYDPYRQKWEKRLTRYFSYLWRVRQARGDYSEPVSVKALLDELKIANEVRPERVRNRLEKALDVLLADGVIRHWQYADEVDDCDLQKYGWFADWLQWRVTVDPPQGIVEHYKDKVAPQGNRRKAAPQALDIDIDDISNTRAARSLSITKAASEIGIDKGTLSRIERGKGADIDKKTRTKLEAWLTRKDPSNPPHSKTVAQKSPLS